MIVYRCLTSDEIIGMINNKEYTNQSIKGENTFSYINGVYYKHFFIFAEHADYYRKRNKSIYPVIGEFIIPKEIIKEQGFGYYGGVTTMRNDSLSSYYMPLPEIIIDMNDFKNEYLYKIESELYSDFITKKLNGDDNEKYNKLMEQYYSSSTGTHGLTGYLDYSYADIYYEMVYQLAKSNNMNLGVVAKMLERVNLHNEIEEYFENNISLFKEQTSRYLENSKKESKIYSIKKFLKSLK